MGSEGVCPEQSEGRYIRQSEGCLCNPFFKRACLVQKLRSKLPLLFEVNWMEKQHWCGKANVGSRPGSHKSKLSLKKRRNDDVMRGLSL